MNEDPWGLFGGASSSSSVPASTNDPWGLFKDAPPAAPAPPVEGFGSRAIDLVGRVLGAPRAGVDALARAGSRFQGLNVPDTATAGSLVRTIGLPGIGGLMPEESHTTGKRLLGRLEEEAAGLALDPTTYAMGGLGETVKGGELAGSVLKHVGEEVTPEIAAALQGAVQSGRYAAPVHNVASAAFTGLMGIGGYEGTKRAIDEVSKNGWTPQAAEDTLGAGIGIGGAALGGYHMLPEAWQDRLMGRTAPAVDQQAASTASVEQAPEPAAVPEAAPVDPVDQRLAERAAAAEAEKAVQGQAPGVGTPGVVPWEQPSAQPVVPEPQQELPQPPHPEGQAPEAPQEPLAPAPAAAQAAPQVPHPEGQPPAAQDAAAPLGPQPPPEPPQPAPVPQPAVESAVAPTSPAQQLAPTFGTTPEELSDYQQGMLSAAHQLFGTEGRGVTEHTNPTDQSRWLVHRDEAGMPTATARVDPARNLLTDWAGSGPGTGLLARKLLATAPDVDTNHLSPDSVALLQAHAERPGKIGDYVRKILGQRVDRTPQEAVASTNEPSPAEADTVGPVATAPQRGEGSPGAEPSQRPADALPPGAGRAPAAEVAPRAAQPSTPEPQEAPGRAVAAQTAPEPSPRATEAPAASRGPQAAPEIKFSAQPNKLGFYSQLQRVAEKIPQAMRGSDMYKYLTDPKRGAKVDEAKWTGLDDFLRSKADQKVTPKEVQDFLRENEVKIEEVTLGRQGKELSDEQQQRFEYLASEAETRGLTQREQREYDKLGGDKAATQSPKYSNQYQLPGGTNYREIVLTAPGAEPWGEEDTIHYGDTGKGRTIAWMRLNDRIDAQGKRVLFVEEIQSKRAQEGRKEGFQTEGDKGAAAQARQEQVNIAAEMAKLDGRLQAHVSELPDLAARAQKLAEYGRLEPATKDQMYDRIGKLRDARDRERAARGHEGPPSAPFVTSTEGWTNLALKRVLRMAAEEEYDKVAWTTGDMQAARYDLSKQIDRLRIEPRNEASMATSRASGGNGAPFRVVAEKDGEHVLDKSVTKAELPELVGKDIAERAIADMDAGKKVDYSGLDLKVGGEGMKGFYDKIIPQTMEKIGKKWGAKVGKTSLDLGNDLLGKTPYRGPTRTIEEVRALANNRENDLPVGIRQELREVLGSMREGESFEDVMARHSPAAAQALGGDLAPLPKNAGLVHSIDISPEMRRSVVEEGQPQFTAEEGKPAAGAPPDREAVRQKLEALFKGQKVEDSPDHPAGPEQPFVVKTPSGKQITVEPAGSISFSLAQEADSLSKHGLEPGSSTIAGSMQSLGRDSWIKITDAGVLPHEVGGHVFLDHFATDAERAFVEREWTKRSEAAGQGKSFDEAFADDYNKWFNDRESAPSTVLGKVFDRIHGFFLRLGKAVGIQTRGGLFREIESGEVFKREGSSPADRIARGPLKPIPDVPQSRFSAAAKAVGERAENFKRWFGASKVLDPKGEPLVVFHRGEFDESQNAVPDINGEGFHFGTKDAADARPMGKMVDDTIRGMTVDQDEDGRWHWEFDAGTSSYAMDEEGFDSEAEARRDGEDAAQSQAENYEPGDEEPALTQAYISLKNPMRVPDQKGDWTRAIKKAKALGHDGLVYKNEFEDKGSTSYVVFEPTQIKSVNNQGTFDPQNPDIRLSATPSAPKLSAQPSPAMAPEAPEEPVEEPKAKTDVTGFTRQSAEGQELEPGSAPRVDERVAQIRKVEKLAGLDPIELSRDTTEKWKSLDPEVQRILRTRSDEDLFNKFQRGDINAAETMAMDARVKDLHDRQQVYADAYKKAQANGSDVGPAQLLQLQNALQISSMEYVRAAGAKTEGLTKAGRALAAAGRVMQGGYSTTDQFMKQVFKEVEGVTDTQATELLRIQQEHPEQLADALQDAMKPSWATKGFFIWKNGMVSAWGSNVAKATGDFTENTLRLGETATASIVDRLGRATGLLPGTQVRFSGEARAELAGALGTLPGAARTWAKNVKDTLKLAPEKIDFRKPLEYQVNPVGGKLGRFFGIPYRLFGNTTEMAQDVGGNAELGKLAYRKAAMELPSASQTAIKARGQEIVKEALNTDSDLHADLLQAVHTSKMDRSFLGKPKELMKGLLSMRANNPWMHVILPFIQVPGKIVEISIDRSPLGFWKAKKAYSAWSKAVAAGAEAKTIESLRGDAVDAIARPLMGTTILATFAALAASHKKGEPGFMTGSGPTDPKERSLLRETGWEPYSFHVGNQYIPFHRLEPVASLMGFAADLNEITDQKQGKDIVDKALGSIMQNLTNKTYLASLAEAAALWKDPMQYGSQYLQSTAGSLVPNIIAKGAQALDPTVRDVTPGNTGLLGLGERLGKTVESRLPGLSSTLPARESATGETVSRPEGLGNALGRFVLPAAPTQEKPGTELEQKLVDLQMAPSTPSRDFKIPAEMLKRSTAANPPVSLRLSDEDYDILQQASKIAADRARRLIQNPRFLALDEDEQKRQLTTLWDRARDLQRQKLLDSREFRAKLREAVL